MRKLVLKMSVSMDGFVGGRNGEVDWVFESLDEGAAAWLVETLWHAGVHIMGSRTFHDMAAYWPTSTEPFAAPMNEIPKVVFSRKGFAALQSPELTTAFRDATRERAAEGLKPSPVLSPFAAAAPAHPALAAFVTNGNPCGAHPFYEGIFVKRCCCSVR